VEKELDTSNPYDEEFRVEWEDGRDPPLRTIKTLFGKGETYRMTLGGVTGLYLVTGICEDGTSVVIEGSRKPDLP